MKTFWISFLAAMAIVVGANLLFDPQAKLGRFIAAYERASIPGAVIKVPSFGRLGAGAFERYSIEEEPALRLAVIGSSNAFSTSSDTFQPSQAARVFWRGAATLTDEIEVGRQLLKRSPPPARILWFFDPYLLNAQDPQDPQRDRTEEGASLMWRQLPLQGRLLKRRFFQLFSLDELGAALEPWLPWLGPFGMDGMPRVLGKQDLVTGGPYYFQGQLRIVLVDPRSDSSAVSFENRMKGWQLDPGKREDLKGLLRDFRQAGCQVLAVMPPLSPQGRRRFEADPDCQAGVRETLRLLKSLKEEGLWDSNAQWLKAEAISQAPGPQFVDGNHMFPDFSYQFLKASFRGKPDWLACLNREALQRQAWARRIPPFIVRKAALPRP